MKRYYILDDIRGIAVISMVLYHLMWDLVYMGGLDIGWYMGLPGLLWQRSICLTFILLSGFCWQLGRHRLRRGLIVFAGGAAVSLATLAVMPENRVLFGILTLLGCSMLIMIPLDRLLCRCPAPAGLIVSGALFAATQNVWMGDMLFGLIKLPETLYRNLLTAWLGFPSDGFFSADYYPMIPWLFLFMAGYFLYGVFQNRDWLRLLERKGSDRLEWLAATPLRYI